MVVGSDWPYDLCPKCGSEYLYRQNHWEQGEYVGMKYNCKECDWVEIVLFEDDNLDNPEASIEAWEWWKAQEVHGNDYED